MTERCPFCGQSSRMIWVRAHYQCEACGQITVPCCNGETAFGCPVEASPAAHGSMRARALPAEIDNVNWKDA